MADNDMLHTTEILKSALPFFDVRTKTTMDLLVKVFDLIGSLQNLQKKPHIVSATEKHKLDLEAMLTNIKPVCNSRERSFVDQMLNIFQAKRTMEMYNNYMSMMKSMQGDSSSQEGNAAENFAKNLAGIDLSSIYKNNSNSSLYGNDSGFPFNNGSGVDLSSIFGTGSTIPKPVDANKEDTFSDKHGNISNKEDTFSNKKDNVSNKKESASDSLKAALEEALSAASLSSRDQTSEQSNIRSKSPIKDSSEGMAATYGKDSLEESTKPSSTTPCINSSNVIYDAPFGYLKDSSSELPNMVASENHTDLSNTSSSENGSNFLYKTSIEKNLSLPKAYSEKKTKFPYTTSLKDDSNLPHDTSERPSNLTYTTSSKNNTDFSYDTLSKKYPNSPNTTSFEVAEQFISMTTSLDDSDYPSVNNVGTQYETSSDISQNSSGDSMEYPHKDNTDIDYEGSLENSSEATTASYHSSTDTNSETSSPMLDTLKTMLPPEKMDTFENLRMLFNNMSYDDNNKSNQNKEEE